MGENVGEYGMDCLDGSHPVLEVEEGESEGGVRRRKGGSEGERRSQKLGERGGQRGSEGSERVVVKFKVRGEVGGFEGLIGGSVRG